MGGHADDFDIALVVQERDAPAHRILVPEVSPRQPLADHCNRRGARLVAVVNLTPGEDGNLHRCEVTGSGGHDACAFDGYGADRDYGQLRTLCTSDPGGCSLDGGRYAEGAARLEEAMSR